MRLLRPRLLVAINSCHQQLVAVAINLVLPLPLPPAAGTSSATPPH
jgi:hypothetical protein